jgi:glycine cleavage system protein P-like pyridoxal-binding family
MTRHRRHIEPGARKRGFGGWDRPIQYVGIYPSAVCFLFKVPSAIMVQSTEARDLETRDRFVEVKEERVEVKKPPTPKSCAKRWFPRRDTVGSRT